MKVHWTDTATQHLRGIHSYIARDSPHYARRTVDRITKRSIQIVDHPLSGRKVPEIDLDQIREVIEHGSVKSPFTQIAPIARIFKINIFNHLRFRSNSSLSQKRLFAGASLRGLIESSTTSSLTKSTFLP